MSYEVAQHILSGFLLGHSLFAASYIGISVAFHIRSKRQHQAARYTAIAATIEAIVAPAAPTYPWETAAACLATLAVALVVTANCPEAAAQPLLPGFAPAGLLPATEWPQSQIKGADLSWAADDDLEVTVDAIAAFESRIQPAIEPPTIAVPNYESWTVKRLRKAVEADYGPMRGYYKKARLIAIMEGDLDQF